MKDKQIDGIMKFPVAIPAADGSRIAETVVIEVPCKIDPVTGEEFLTGEALEAIDRVKARHMGLLQPEEICNLRKCIGLTQKEMSDLLQIGAKSYSRWENGKERPFRSLNILLRALWDGKLDVNYLRSIQTAKFNWWPKVHQLIGSKKVSPYTVDVSGSKETCHETKRPAA